MFQTFLSWMRCIIATKVNFLSVLGKSIQIEYSKWQWQVNKSTMISRCVNLLPCFLRLHHRPPIFKSVFVASPSFSRVPPSLPCQWSSSTATTWTTMPSQLTTSPRLWCKAGHCMDNRICLFLNIRHLSLASAFVTSWVMSASSCIPEWKCRKQQTHLKRVKARFCWEIKEYKTSLDSCIHYFILGALKSTSWLDPNPIDPTDLDKCAMAFFPVQQLSSCRTAGREPEEFFSGFATGKSPLRSGPISNIVEASWKFRSTKDRKRVVNQTSQRIWNDRKNATCSSSNSNVLQLNFTLASPNIVDHHSSWLNQACFWWQKPESLPGDAKGMIKTFPKQKPTAGRRNTMQGPAKCTSGDGLLLAFSQSLHRCWQVRDSTPRVHRKQLLYNIHVIFISQS